MCLFNVETVLITLVNGMFSAAYQWLEEIKVNRRLEFECLIFLANFFLSGVNLDLTAIKILFYANDFGDESAC